MSGQGLEQATFQRGLNLLQPGLDREKQAVHQRLVDRGIPIGSEAYNDALGQYDQSKNLALENLALSSVGAGRQEQSRLFDILSRARGQQSDDAARQYAMNQAAQQQTFDQGSRLFDESLQGRTLRGNEDARQYALNMAGQQQNFDQNSRLFDESMSRRNQGLSEYLISRNQPLSELGALLGMQRGVAMPQFQPVSQYGTDAPNLAGLTQSNYAQQMAQYNQGKSDFWGGMFGLGAAAIPLFSDRRLKKDIKRVGRLDNGLPIYRFRYKSGGGYQIGLMSDDVAQVHPEAIGERDGFDTVDYRVATQ